MQVILLCAGTSSRMNPISEKPLLEFCGKTLIEHQLIALKESGFNRFVIVGNKENLPNLEIAAKKVEHIECKFAQQTNMNDGMKGAIEVCKKHIEKEAFIVNSNDIVEKVAFEQVMEESQKNKYEAVICGKVVEKYFPGGYLSVNNGLLTDIIEKPGEGNEPSNLVNIVLHYFKDFHNFLTIVEACGNNSDDAYEQALQKLCEEKPVKVVEYSGIWQAIKFPWHILDAQKIFFSNKQYIHSSAQIAESAVIKGNVYIDEGVKVFEHATIAGPCYIGKNAVIANNALVRESHIGEGCVIGYSTEIARSYLHKNIWTHSNYIGDSVIDSNVSFGAGTVTGNLRLDEKNISVFVKGERINSEKNKLGSIIGSGTRIGTQCSINPGVKIGCDVFVGSSVNIGKDVENKKFLYLDQKLIEKDNSIAVSTQNREQIS